MPSTQKYRAASLWFDADSDDLSVSRQSVNWREARRGTVQHEVFEGDRAVPFADGDVLAIKVNCRKDAGRLPGPVPYGLAVSLEVAEGLDITIYEQVQARIAIPVPVRSSATEE